MPYTILAAAAVLVLIGALALFDRAEDTFQIDVADSQETDVPAVGLSTTTETLDPVVAENLAVGIAFMDAFVSGEIDEALSYAVDGQIHRDLSSSLAFVRNEWEWMAAVDWTVQAEDCAVTVADPANTWVTCTVVNETAWGRALGLGPYPSEYRFRINKGEHGRGYWDLTEPTITQMEDEFPWTAFNNEVMDPFRSWLEINHPNDIDGMFQPADTVGGSRVVPWVIPEVRDLWQQYTEEFVAQQVTS